MLHVGHCCHIAVIASEGERDSLMVDNRGTESGFSEAERQKMIAQLAERLPGRDLSKLLAGHLAGPADPDRPPVPIWEFVQYAATAGTGIGELAKWRYPLEIFEGGSTIVSIAEEVDQNLRGHPRITAADVIRRYQLLANSGAITWSARRKSIIELVPREEKIPIYRAWWEEVTSRAS